MLQSISEQRIKLDNAEKMAIAEMEKEDGEYRARREICGGFYCPFRGFISNCLSAVSGELLHASWQCVAPGGIMIDIGKKDVLGHGQLDMSRFAHNCTFTCFDGWEMIKKGGDGEHNLRELMQEVMDLYEQGHVKLIRPISVFGVTNIEDAYRYMQQGQHVGKIVIRSIDAEEEPLVATPSVPLPSFRDDA